MSDEHSRNELSGSEARDRASAKSARDEDFERELKSHLDLEAEEQKRPGISDEEARFSALRAFGNSAAVGEDVRGVWRARWFEQFAHDLRFAARMLLKSPSFLAVALLSLALGIGANTAIFTLIDALMLRTLPVDRPQELERFESYYSNPMYRELRERNQAFSALIASQATPVSLVAVRETDRAIAELVSGNYFATLGVQPFLGRLISDEDDSAALAHPVAVLGFQFWQQRLGSDPGAVGKTIHINNHPFTVIGIAPPRFAGVAVESPSDLWVPVTMQPQVFFPGVNALDDTGDAWLRLMGRRKPGLSEASANAGIVVTLTQIAKEGRHKLYKSNVGRARIHLFPGAVGFSELREEFARPLYLLMTVVALVLLIACVNLANLLVARSAARRREIAVRLSLGAGRFRLVRQLLTESVALSLCGGMIGIVLSVWCLGLLTRFLPASLGQLSMPVVFDPRINPRVLLFAFGVSILTGVLFGLVPALQSTRADLSHALKDEGATLVAGPRRFQIGRFLAVAQVALSLLLLVGASLFLRSLQNAYSNSTGFNTDNVLMASVNPSLSGYALPQESAFLRDLQARLESLPGVQSVAFSEVPFFTGEQDGGGFQVPGKPVPPDYHDRSILLNRVSGEFWKTLGATIIRGRGFLPGDTATSQPVAIINERAAAHFFPGEEPVGQKVNFRRVAGVEIIGVCSDSKYTSVTEETPRIVYTTLDQDTQFIGSGNRTIYLRTSGDPHRLIPLLRQQVQSLDASLPLYDIKTLAEQKSDSLFQERMIGALSGFFGGLALLLAAIGLYGVMAYSVNRRTREIGIRISMGAARGDVLWLVLRDCLLMVGAGIAIGVPVSIALSRLVRAQLFGVTPSDPAAYLVAIFVLAAVGAAAGGLPSFRASRVDPLIALRYE